jgi:hypothetical protein
MEIREWNLKETAHEMTVTILGPKEQQALQEKLEKAEDPFQAIYIKNNMGVKVSVTQKGSGKDAYKAFQSVLLTITPEKARELGQFLIDATEDLV